jgi:predicted secreted protein
MMMKAASMDAESVTPEVEAGTSKVTMTADGVVEVLMQ